MQLKRLTKYDILASKLVTIPIYYTITEEEKHANKQRIDSFYCEMIRVSFESVVEEWKKGVGGLPKRKIE